MSNRRKAKPTPPPAVAAYARAYVCGHCDSVTARPRFDAGIWRIDVHHDDTCPVLSGTVPVRHAGLRATDTVVETTGRPVLYVTTQETPS